MPSRIDAIVDVPFGGTVGQIAFLISVETGWLSNVRLRFLWAVCFK